MNTGIEIYDSKNIFLQIFIIINLHILVEFYILPIFLFLSTLNFYY